MVMFTTERLVLREVATDDLSGLLPVYHSNPDLVMANVRSQGEAGDYDLAMFQPDP
jgi:hypothetical protein